MLDCLFKEGEDTSNAILVDGITMKAGFHPERLGSHREEIRQALSELPEMFRKESEAGGESFLNMCYIADGTQWTGLQRDMEALAVIGVGLGFVTLLGTNSPILLSVLPGNVPMVILHGVATAAVGDED